MSEKILVTRSSMPSFEEYAEMIKPLWESHWLTNMGQLHKEFEKSLKEYLGVDGISLMVNGHMSLEMALTAMKLPEGSEVITTPFTFISTTHAIVRNGFKPVFCDIKMSDYTIDENKMEALVTEKTAAILPVHVYGQICAVDQIRQIADKYNLKVIYDAAHAFGVTCDGKGVGCFGDASTFSFHATKVFHSIEGGAVTFHNPDLYRTLYNLKNFGIRSEEVVAEVGANAKMNEFSAAMGICNLRHIEQEIAKRRKVVEKYRELLRGQEGIRLLDEQEGVKSNYAYFPILIDETRFPKTRNQVYTELREQNIFARKYFYPLTSDQACFRNRYRDVDLTNARYVSDRILVLPLYADLELENVEKIVECILR
ncbi:MAG: DegT/DnrJ/EryC1/StrS family aminotransferase [Clostridiaceae bacterium]|nr:DegT/DnrJ/EryC1/StrS family aminotransferase [Clostridiaceae bacterium]